MSIDQLFQPNNYNIFAKSITETDTIATTLTWTNAGGTGATTNITYNASGNYTDLNLTGITMTLGATGGFYTAALPQGARPNTQENFPLLITAATVPTLAGCTLQPTGPTTSTITIRPITSVNSGVVVAVPSTTMHYSNL